MVDYKCQLHTCQPLAVLLGGHDPRNCFHVRVTVHDNIFVTTSMRECLFFNEKRSISTVKIILIGMYTVLGNSHFLGLLITERNVHDNLCTTNDEIVRMRVMHGGS